jgi:hypothetical protein
MAMAERHGPIGVDPAAVIDLLRRWLSRMLAPEAMQWLDAEIERQRASVDERRLGIALGLAGRKTGRLGLALSADDEVAASHLRARWQPQMWGADEASRIAVLLATHHGNDQPFAVRVDRLCATGELTEHVAYLKGFAVFPAAERLYVRAREAVRSSAQPIFQAIACHNPYPCDYFDEMAWNQMVVKCVFNGLPIETVFGLEERRNAELVKMLRDFVSERQAADRPLPEAVHRYIEGTLSTH